MNISSILFTLFIIINKIISFTHRRLMLQNSLIKVAFAAMSLVATDSLVASRASINDSVDYPEIEKAFVDWGKNYYWKAYDEWTDDGYILTIFRITGKTKTKAVPNQWTKGVVFLLHGFTKDAYTWFDHRRGDMSKPVLPVMLFDLGYDVWLGNIRGTRYSLSHKKYDAFDDDKKFFNYEIEKIARNDIPTMIEQIMKTQAYYKKRGGRTCKKVNVIAHSAGVG